MVREFLIPLLFRCLYLSTARANPTPARTVPGREWYEQWKTFTDLLDLLLRLLHILRPSIRASQLRASQLRTFASSSHPSHVDTSMRTRSHTHTRQGTREGRRYKVGAQVDGDDTVRICLEERSSERFYAAIPGP